MASNLVRSATRRSFSTALFAAAVGLGQVILLARLVPKTELALVALSSVWVGLAAHLQEGGINAAIVQRPQSPHAVLSTLYWFNLAQGIALWICVVLSGWGMAFFYDAPSLLFLTAAYAMVLVISGSSLQYKALLQKNFRFRELSRAEIGGVMTSFVVSIFLAWQGWGAWAIVCGYLARQLVESSLLLLFGIPIFRPAFTWQPSEARPWFKTGFSHLGERLTTHFVSQLDTLLIGKIWGTEALGAYDTFRRVIFRPIVLVSGAAEQVAFPLLSKLQSRITYLRQAYLRMLNSLGTLLFPVCIAGMLLAEPLIQIAFGADWLAYTPVFQWLCVMAMLTTLLNPTDTLLLVKGKIHLWQRVGLAQGALTLVALGILQNQSIALATGGLAAVQGLLWAFVLIRVLPQQTGTTFFEGIKAAGTPFLCSVIAALPLVFVAEQTMLGLQIAALAVFTALYVILTRWWNKDIYTWLLSLLKQNPFVAKNNLHKE